MANTKAMTNDELVDDMMRRAMYGFARSGPDGTLRNVLNQNPELQELRKAVLERMQPHGVKTDL